MVVFSLRDEGKGVASEDKERIFQRRQRGEASEGLGLGLWFAKMVIGAHGGRIGVESEDRSMVSNFIFTLPAVEYN